MGDYESVHDNQIKHMEMIQGVVSRLAGNSFLIKGWALTLTGAFLGFAVNKSSSGLAAAALIPIVLFWALDSYYLRVERLFRALFEEVRTSSAQSADPFFMGATSDEFVKRAPDHAKSWRKVLFRGTAVGFYGLLVIAALLLVVILCSD
jgi:hypothetical protein